MLEQTTLQNEFDTSLIKPSRQDRRSVNSTGATLRAEPSREDGGQNPDNGKTKHVITKKALKKLQAQELLGDDKVEISNVFVAAHEDNSVDSTIVDPFRNDAYHVADEEILLAIQNGAPVDIGDASVNEKRFGLRIVDFGRNKASGLEIKL